MLLNRCSLKKREHQPSPSVRDSPEEKRLRHVRLSVMKGTPQRISSISWFSWKHEYSAKCVRYFHQRNIWVHNFQKEIRKSITESHAPPFFFFPFAPDTLSCSQPRLSLTAAFHSPSKPNSTCDTTQVGSWFFLLFYLHILIHSLTLDHEIFGELCSVDITQ